MVLSDLDRELLNRCLAKADGAWEAFIDRYLALITHVVLSTSKVRFENLPADVRDDIVAEILLTLVEDDYAVLRRFRGQSSLSTYLVVVARRIAARRISKLGPAANGQHLETQAIQEDIPLDNQEEVQTLLKRLPENEAAAIRMFHLEHRSYSDIGAEMGIPENSVGPLLSRARQNMRSLKD